jgi:hypothetical protein
MTSRKGCEEHPVAQPGCYQCVYDDNCRLRTAIEKEVRNQKATARLKRDLMKALRGSE